MTSNIDDELLALAGGDESSSEGEGAAASASKSKPSVRRKQRKAAAHDSSDEDAEGSDEDEDDEEEDSGPLYPYEGTYKDYEDKMRIEQLPLIDRESVLANRRDEILSRERSRQLRGMVAAQQGRKESSSSKKRKTPSFKKAKSTRKKQNRAESDMEEETEEEDDSDDQEDDDEEEEAPAEKGRSSGRSRKTVGQSETRNKTLQELSKNRRKRAAGKANNARHRDEDETRRRGRRSSSDSDDEESDESEGYVGSGTETKRTSGRQGRSRREEGPFIAPDLDDINKARIGREDILKVMYRKGWEDKLIGNFVRVVADSKQDERTGKTVQRYRAYEIIGWKTGSKWYQVDTGKYTKVKLELRFAKEKHEKQILFVSNADITEEEFQRYELQARESTQRPSKKQVLAQADEWDEFVNEPWSEEVFTAVVKARKEAKREAELAGSGNGKSSYLQRSQNSSGFNRTSSAASTDAPKGEDVLLAELNERNRRSDRERILEAEKRQAENRRMAAMAALTRGGALSNGGNSGELTPNTPLVGTGEGPGSQKSSIVDIEIDLGDF